jgi:hypothetical protein
MGTAYVIPGIDYETLLMHIEDNELLNITKQENEYMICLTNIPTRIALNKRIRLANMTKLPPDNIPKGGVPTVFLRITTDKDNSWFDGYSTAISSPEIVLAVIIEILSNIGINTTMHSEHDQEFWDISDGLDESFVKRLAKAFNLNN